MQFKPWRVRWAANLAVVATALALAACGGGGSETTTAAPARAAPSSADAWMPAVTMPAELATADLTQRPRSLAKSAVAPARFALGVLPKAMGVDASTFGMPGVARQVGVHRAVEAFRKSGGSTALDWRANDDGGKSASVLLSSEGAVGLRAGLLVQALPDEAVVHLYAPGSVLEHVFSGQQINEVLARNRAAGEFGEEARTWWAPYVEGTAITLDIEVPPGVDPGGVVLPAVRLSHFFQSPLAAAAETHPKINPGASESCNLDASCYSAWSSQRNSTVHLVFSKDGGSYLCTGTLLGDSSSSLVPYLLTANHCFSSQASASSVQTHWFAESASCNSSAISSAYTTRSGGGTLLYASGSTDTSFMRLAATPPAGAAFAGWYAGMPAIGTPATGVHHPSGDLKKISFGSIRTFGNCTVVNGVSCSGASSANSSHVEIQFTSGTTEGGSSGSAIWATVNGTPLVIGQLSGGSSSCSLINGSNYYGRFDVAYNAALKTWLGAGAGTGTGATPPPSGGTAVPQTGWWWSSVESGRGFAIEVRGTVIYMAGFMYTDAGRDVWYSADLRRTAAGNYTGDLRSFSGGNDRVESVTAQQVTGNQIVAAVELSFANAAAGTLKITQNGVSKTVGLARYPVSPTGGASNASFENGWWYAPSENGHGYFIEVQGNYVFAATYTYYNAGGLPGWYLQQASSLAGASGFSASNDWYAGGQSLVGAYKAPTGPNKTGTMSFTATSATTGVLRFSAGGVVNVQRFVF